MPRAPWVRGGGWGLFGGGVWGWGERGFRLKGIGERGIRLRGIGERGFRLKGISLSLSLRFRMAKTEGRRGVGGGACGAVCAGEARMFEKDWMGGREKDG